MTKRFWNFLLFFLGIVCFLSSCATPTVQHESEGGEISDASKNGAQALDHSAIFDQDPRLIAILPFENLTQNDDEEEKFNETEIARKTFANHFSSRGYKIQWIHTTDKLLKKEGYETVDEVVQLPLKDLGRITNADVIIFGQLTHFDRLFLGMYAQVAVGARVKLVEVATGKVLWEKEDVSRGHMGGFAIDPLGAALTFATNVLALREIELLEEAENLFREMVKTIPYVKLEKFIERPQINLFVNNASKQAIKTGGTIQVGMTGDPNHRATFALGDYRTGLTMRESEPGVYVGSYEVKSGDNATNLVVHGFLENDNGLMTEWVDALGPVTLDTITPVQPSEVVVRGENHRIRILWNPGADKDVKGYRVYRSTSPLTGFQPVEEVESPTYVDQGLMNGKPYYYKITAFDQAGNESPFSKEISATPIAPGPTFVKGELTHDQVWLRGASPYVLAEDVIVARGSSLTIEPGTEIISRGGGLSVRGQIFARGTSEHMIVFSSDPKNPQGWWPGIVLDLAGERHSIFDYVRISKALVGLTCLGSSPRITHSELTLNGTGLVVRSVSTHSVIEDNSIGLNVQDGVVIEDGAQPLLTGNRIFENGRYGVNIQNTAGFVIHGNDIVENKVFQLVANGMVEMIDVNENWWGTPNPAKILTMISGRVNIHRILTDRIPKGRPLSLSVLDSTLGGVVRDSGFLMAAQSPYLVTRPVILEQNAVLTIQPGVIIKFARGPNSFVIRGGSIRALGSVKDPILFTSASASPNPGDYETAITFEIEGQEQSLLQYVSVRYAGTAFVVHQGSPEFDHVFIGSSLQSAVKCTGHSAPTITYSTIREHRTNAAVLSLDSASPVLHRNHIVANAWAVINHSPLPLDARENWWGSPSPSKDLFLGMVEYTPTLLEPDQHVFDNIAGETEADPQLAKPGLSRIHP